MTERKLTAEDIKELKVVVAERSFMSLRVRQIGSLIADLEIERLRVDNRCERHGGYLDKDFCYPCHTENLIKAEAEVERLRHALYIYHDRMKEYPELRNLVGSDVLKLSQDSYDTVRTEAQAALEDAE